MLLLPVTLGLTAYSVLNPQQVSFSFAVPQLSLKTIAIFTLCALLHELGHLVTAHLLNAEISGVGFGIRMFVPQFFVKIDGVTDKERK